MTNKLSAFTLFEMLVATAVFSLLIVTLLSLTSAMLKQSTRMDENAEADRDVRVFFDFLRRDLAQARIGTNQNFFRGESNRLFFVASTSKLKTEYISDARLMAYYQIGRQIYRTVVDPTDNNLGNGTWSAGKANWWANASITDTNKGELILDGAVAYTDQNGSASDLFSYVAKGNTGNLTASPTSTNNPPSGVVVALGLLSKNAKLRHTTNRADIKNYKYEIELNLPPAYDP